MAVLPYLSLHRVGWVSTQLGQYCLNIIQIPIDRLNKHIALNLW